jgi:hypothetical protein
MAAIAVLLLSIGARGQVATAVGLAPTAPPTDTSHAERCLAGIDLAIIAAEAGVIDVSFEAMRRATTKGPPVSSVELGGLLSNKGAARARSTSGVPSREQEAESAQMKVAKRLQILHAAWRDQKVDPAAAYAAFKSMVLPETRQSEAFCYAESVLNVRGSSYSNIDFDVEAPKLIDSGVAALVEWSRLAQREDDLLAEVEKRAKLPTAAAAALLIEVILARDPSRRAMREALCEQLVPQTKLLVDSPDAELLLGHVWQMLEQDAPDLPARKKLIEAVLSATHRAPNWSNNRWLVYLVVGGMRDALEAGDGAKFRTYADTALSIYNPIRANNADYVASREAALYAEASRRAFEASQLKLAADCLRAGVTQAASDRYLQTQFHAILDPAQPVMQNLLKLESAERFELFNSLVWLMPQLGMASGARMHAVDRVPPLFTRAVDVPAEALVWRELARENARSVSLLEWTMREAIALNKQATIESEIAKLESGGSDDAKLARLVYSLAQGKPMDLALVTKTDARNNKSLTPAMGDNGRVTPLDIEIIEQALAGQEHRKLGERLADKLLSMAISEHQDLFVTLLRDVKSRLRTDPPAATHVDLVHWTAADDVAGADYVAGHLPGSLWIKRDDKNTWGQQFGIDYSVLMLRYPLTGDFAISFRTRDAQYREGAATLGGRLIEFLEYRGGLQVSGLGQRNTSRVETDALTKNRFNAVRLECKGEALIVHVADKFQKELVVPAGEFPFFGMGANHFRETSFDSLVVEGDVTIPRSVDMVSPSLAGWSARFKGQRLPDMAVLPEQETAIDDDNINYDWRLADGALESVNRTDDKKATKSKHARPNREALIRYLRPLGDGEQISLEFYHEPGRHTIAPALGRIAMLLDDGKVALHWITTDPAGIVTGVDDSNRVIDDQAQQLHTIALKDNDWNQLALRLDGDVVMLSVNGQDAYRRTWEAEAGRQFGLFRDPTQFHVRVRNMKLIGPWPEKLPADLFELKPKEKLTSVQ